jgi:hypothetical protein
MLIIHCKMIMAISQNWQLGSTLLLVTASHKMGRDNTQQNDTQHNDIQHDDIQHDDIQHNDIQHYDTPRDGIALMALTSY